MAYDCAGDSLAKIIEDNSPRKQLSNIEQDFDDVTNHKKDSIINSTRTALVVLLVIMLIVTFGLTAIIIKNKKRLKNIISKLEEMRIQASEKEQQSFSIFIEQLGNFIEINSKNEVNVKGLKIKSGGNLQITAKRVNLWENINVEHGGKLIINNKMVEL